MEPSRIIIPTPVSFEEHQIRMLQDWNPSQPREQVVKEAIQQWRDLDDWRIAKLAEALVWETQVLTDATKWEEIQRSLRLDPWEHIALRKQRVKACILSYKILIDDSIQAARDQLYASTRSCMTPQSTSP